MFSFGCLTEDKILSKAEAALWAGCQLPKLSCCQTRASRWTRNAGLLLDAMSASVGLLSHHCFCAAITILSKHVWIHSNHVLCPWDVTALIVLLICVCYTKSSNVKLKHQQCFIGYMFSPWNIHQTCCPDVYNPCYAGCSPRVQVQIGFTSNWCRTPLAGVILQEGIHVQIHQLTFTVGLNDQLDVRCHLLQWFLLLTFTNS